MTAENGSRRLPHRVAELYEKLQNESQETRETATLSFEILEILDRAIKHPRKGRYRSTSEFYRVLKMHIEMGTLNNLDAPWNKEPINSTNSASAATP